MLIWPLQSETANYYPHLARFLWERHVALGSVQYTHSTETALQVTTYVMSSERQLLKWSDNSSNFDIVITLGCDNDSNELGAITLKSYNFSPLC
jgi:hypothetical protein